MKELTKDSTLEEFHDYIMNSEGIDIPEEIYEFTRNFQCACCQEHNDSCMHSDLKGS